MKVPRPAGAWRSASPGWPCGPRLVRAWTPSRTAWSGVDDRPRHGRAARGSRTRPDFLTGRHAEPPRGAERERRSRRPVDPGQRRFRRPERQSQRRSGPGDDPSPNPSPTPSPSPRRLRRLHLLLSSSPSPPITLPDAISSRLLGLRPDRPARLRVVGGDRPSENHALPHGLTLGHRARGPPTAPVGSRSPSTLRSSGGPAPAPSAGAARHRRVTARSKQKRGDSPGGAAVAGRRHGSRKAGASTSTRSPRTADRRACAAARRHDREVRRIMG